MGYEQHCYVFIHHYFTNAGDAFSLKCTIAHREGFVDHQYFRVDSNRKGKAQARLHAARIRAHGLVDIHAQLGEIDNLRLDFADFAARKTKDLSAKCDVFAPR